MSTECSTIIIHPLKKVYVRIVRDEKYELPELMINGEL